MSRFFFTATVLIVFRTCTLLDHCGDNSIGVVTEFGIEFRICVFQLIYRMPLSDVETRQLQVTVWSYDALKENEFLGAVTIDLSHINFSRTTTDWYHLHMKWWCHLHMKWWHHLHMKWWHQSGDIIYTWSGDRLVSPTHEVVTSSTHEVVTSYTHEVVTDYT